MCTCAALQTLTYNPPRVQVGAALHASANEALWRGFHPHGTGGLPGSPPPPLRPADLNSSSGGSNDGTSSGTDGSTRDGRTRNGAFAFRGAGSVDADFATVVGSPERGALVGDLVQHRGHFYKPKVQKKTAAFRRIHKLSESFIIRSFFFFFKRVINIT